MEFIFYWVPLSGYVLIYPLHHAYHSVRHFIWSIAEVSVANDRDLPAHCIRPRFVLTKIYVLFEENLHFVTLHSVTQCLTPCDGVMWRSGTILTMHQHGSQVSQYAHYDLCDWRFKNEIDRTCTWNSQQWVSLSSWFNWKFRNQQSPVSWLHGMNHT